MRYTSAILVIVFCLVLGVGIAQGQTCYLAGCANLQTVLYVDASDATLLAALQSSLPVNELVGPEQLGPGNKWIGPSLMLVKATAATFIQAGCFQGPPPPLFPGFYLVFAFPKALVGQDVNLKNANYASFLGALDSTNGQFLSNACDVGGIVVYVLISKPK